MVLIVTIISLVISYFVIISLKQERQIQNSVYIIYLVWHLPLVLSIILPFSYFNLDESEKIGTIVFFLTVLHLIICSGVFAYHKYKLKNKINNKQVIYKSAESKTKFNYYLLIYVPGAFLASIFWLLDTQTRGYQLSFESIKENRTEHLALSKEGKLESSPFSFIAGFLGGLTFYLLYKAIDIKYINNKIKLTINWLFFLPFISYFLVTFIRGNKGTLIPGILMFVFKLIYVFKPKLKKLTLILAIVFFAVLNIAVTQTILRQSSDFNYSYIGLKTNKDHPLAIIENNPNLYFASGTLYLYYGLQYDMLSATVNTFKEPIVPFGALTATVFYSRITSIFSLPSWKEENNYFSDRIQSKYRVFAGVWGTMFLAMYLEGGWIYILIVVLILSSVHFIVVKNYLIKQGEQNLLLLIVFYSIIILGVQRSPIGNPTVISLVVFSYIKPEVNKLVRYIVKPFIKNKKELA